MVSVFLTSTLQRPREHRQCPSHVAGKWRNEDVTQDHGSSSRGCACSHLHATSKLQETNPGQITTRCFAVFGVGCHRRKQTRRVELGRKSSSLVPDEASQGGLSPVSLLPDG